MTMGLMGLLLGMNGALVLILEARSVGMLSGIRLRALLLRSDDERVTSGKLRALVICSSVGGLRTVDSEAANTQITIFRNRKRNNKIIIIIIITTNYQSN